MDVSTDVRRSGEERLLNAVNEHSHYKPTLTRQPLEKHLQGCRDAVCTDSSLLLCESQQESVWLVLSHFLMIINTSLRPGLFPGAFKTSVMKPLLEKPSPRRNALTSYRPKSNLPLIRKTLSVLSDPFSTDKFLP